jgi:hypothetical protein
VKKIEMKKCQSCWSYSDRTLVTGGQERPIRGSSEDANVGLRPDAGSQTDRTLEGCIRSQLMWQHNGQGN